MNDLMIAIPQNIENLQLPSPELLAYYNDLQRRVIWIDDFIDESLLFTVKRILNWNCEDVDIPVEQRKPIHILIFSPGGELDFAFSLIDTIRMSKTPIVTVNMGNAMSAGLYILLAGHKRFALPSSIALLHSGAATLGGTASQTLASAQSYKNQLDRIKGYVLERTAIKTRTLNSRKDDDWYFTAEEQFQHGIVDEVISNIDQLINKTGRFDAADAAKPE